MKRSTIIPAVLVITALTASAKTAAAQATGGSPRGQHTTPMKHDSAGGHNMKDMQMPSSGWQELDAVHGILRMAWQPAMMSNDLSMAKSMAPALAATADTWAKAKVPAACDTKENRAAIAAVKTQSATVAKLVADNAADSTVKKALELVHTSFRGVAHSCEVKP
jgi:hypothetical protein